MKKRVFSIFLALALCLTLLSATALAEGAEGGAAQIGDTVYSTLPEAVNAAKDGDTIKLLADYKTAEGAGEEEDDGLTITKSVTLDLNGYKMDDFRVAQVNDAGETLPSGNLTVEDTSKEKSGTVSGMIELVVGKLTINGGTIGDGRDGVRIENGNLTVNGGTIDFLYGSNSGTVTITGGTVKNAQFGPDFEITVTGGSGHTGLWDVSEGTWSISGGEFGDVTFLTASPAKNATISGGTFGKITRQILKIDGNGEKVPAPISGLLADGYAFYEQAAGSEEYDRCVRLDDMITYWDNVQVKPHTHNFTGNHNGCTECGKEFAASVTQNGAVTYYEDFAAALNAAKVGDTLTLLNTVRSDATLVAIDKAIILDLNGYNIQGLGVYAKATIKDSSETKGTIGTLSVSGNGLTLGDLLEPGYAFRTTNAWCIETKEGVVVSDVTVQQAPITKVTLTALNADNAAASTTMPYGTTGGIKLFAHCDPKPGVTELSCQWYTIGGTIQPIDGAKGTEYNLPADLSMGEHSYRVTCTADGYSKSADITITVEKIDLANATVTIDTWPADGKFRFYPHASETAALSFLSVVTVTANGEKYPLSSDDYTYEGATATRVGKYTLTITATDSCANFKGSKVIPWEVIPYQLYRPAFQGSQTYTKTYDGTTTLPGSYTWLADFYGKEGIDQNVTLKSGDYEVTAAEFVSADAGENKPINQTITLKNENFVFSPTEIIKIPGITTTDKTLTYTNFTPKEAYPTGGTTFNIEKATMPDFDNAVTLEVINNHADTYTVDLSALLPALEAPRKYGAVTYGAPTVNLSSDYYTSGAKVEDGKLILPIKAVETKETGSIGSVKVKVSTTNYHDFTLTINVNATNKTIPTGEPTLSKNTLAWGEKLSAIKLSGAMKDGDTEVKGTFAWTNSATTPSDMNDFEAEWKFTPENTDVYAEITDTVTIKVIKATPTGAPKYTAINASGKTLTDAALAVNEAWPEGTVQWVDKDGKELPDTTEVKANTAYKWIFTPDAEFAANYTTAEGTVILYSVSTGGGGGGSSSDRDTSSSGTVKTETTKNNDGSVTKTETKKDGTVIETTTGKDGSVSKTESKPDGSSVTENKAADGSTGTVKTDKNGQTTAEIALSSKAIDDAKKNGEAVKAPAEVEASRNSSTAPTVSIELPKGAGETKVEIPVSNVTPGTVAVLVHPDGTEEILKNSVPTEDGIQLTVDGSATVKIIDNSKDFIDTRNHWAKDAIDFVSARGLVNGMSATIYAPNNSTTRAQLWTILARQNDANLNGGNTWYESAQNWAKAKGVSDGANPNADINRAQMVTMLWRAEGQPAAGGTASFTDVSADSYYAQAVAWAVENGITTGVGGGRFNPTGTCTRAQIAAFLARSMK